ncbi:MAG: TetR/AcrR family transcriptional regulator [Burkholderiaceae bacterium]|nr:TetR/AcrR family transcriptional regulator [Burkholderiaceae bacterium]
MSKAPLSSIDLPPRERILVAAHELFYRNGIRATGIDRVIESSRVTKVTFYRHYPSKNDLVRAYLEYRHERWIAWLTASLGYYIASGASAADALLSTFEDWWLRPDYRGCAFINAAAELGSSDPWVLDIVRRHKAEMATVFEQLLLAGPDRAGRAHALALVVDGAIVHAQMGLPVAALLEVTKLVVEPLLAS